MTFRQIDQNKICKNRHICAYLIILSCFIVTILDIDKEPYIYDVYIEEECGRAGGVEICHVFADSIFLYNNNIYCSFCGCWGLGGQKIFLFFF